MTDTERRLHPAHQARRAKEHQLDDIRRALCDVGVMRDDDPYSHADLADVIRQAATEPTTAPRDGLSAPLSAPQAAEPPAPGREEHPGGENGPQTGTQDRAELCRRFEAALTRQWGEVARFVMDDVLRDVVDCHLELVARATANLLADSHRQAEEAEAALARVRALHQPHPEGGIGHLPDGGYGDISPACAACGTHDEYAVPWPCPTIRALDAPQAGDDTTAPAREET